MHENQGVNHPDAIKAGERAHSHTHKLREICASEHVSPRWGKAVGAGRMQVAPAFGRGAGGLSGPSGNHCLRFSLPCSEPWQQASRLCPQGVSTVYAPGNTLILRRIYHSFRSPFQFSSQQSVLQSARQTKHTAHFLSQGPAGRHYGPAVSWDSPRWQQGAPETLLCTGL